MLDTIKIENMIYIVRGKQVIFDSDLAKLYGVETKRINEAVKNNPLKFPERFSWILTKEELVFFSRSKFSTLKKEKLGRGQNIKYLPRVFTEQGVAMLATILKSRIAVETSIAIMDAFVKMRHYILENKDIYKSLNNINNKIIEHDEKLNFLFSKFDKKEKLFLPGEFYDAYSEMLDIVSSAKNELIIIDSYADKNLLDLIKNVNCSVIVITSFKTKITDIMFDKFNKQYNNRLKLIKNKNFHDRYFILDRSVVYHSGASVNYAGFKTFSINKLEDNVVKNSLLNYINNIII